MRHLMTVLATAALAALLTACDSSSATRSPAQTYLDTLAAASQPEPEQQAEAEGEADDAEADTAAADGRALFDGTTLDGWQVTDFAGHGDVEVDNGNIILGFAGNGLTGITWEDADALPRSNYEISLQAKRVDGNDFFCGLTFPVGDDHCTLIAGGWGGTVVGLSSLDGFDASSNDTTTLIGFEEDRWYDIRLRVEDDRIQAWIDDEPVVDIDPADYRIDIRYEVSNSRPLGIAAWNTTAALRDIHLRELD